MCKIDTLETLITSTPRGGRHIYIPYNERFITITNEPLFFDVKNSPITPYLDEGKLKGTTLAFEGDQYHVINNMPIQHLSNEIYDKIYNTYYAPSTNKQSTTSINIDGDDFDFQPINDQDFIDFENSPYFCDALKRQNAQGNNSYFINFYLN